jgi:hypothetical protein
MVASLRVCETFNFLNDGLAPKRKTSPLLGSGDVFESHHQRRSFERIVQRFKIW